MSSEGKFCRASMPDAWRFTEWSRREPSDMDGQVQRPSERERASQTPYRKRRLSLDMTIERRRAFSSQRAVRLVDSKFRRCFDQCRDFGQMPGKFWISLQPHRCSRGANKMRGPAATQSLKMVDCLAAVVRMAVVDRVVLQKMPTLPLRIIKNGRIAHVRGHDQRIWRCRFVQFQTG